MTKLKWDEQIKRKLWYQFPLLNVIFKNKEDIWLPNYWSIYFLWLSLVPYIKQKIKYFFYFLWMHRLALRISKLQKDARLEYDPVNKSRLVRIKKIYNKASRNHGQWVLYWFSCFWFLSFNIFFLSFYIFIQFSEFHGDAFNI